MFKWLEFLKFNTNTLKYALWFEDEKFNQSIIKLHNTREEAEIALKNLGQTSAKIVIVEIHK